MTVILISVINIIESYRSIIFVLFKWGNQTDYVVAARCEKWLVTPPRQGNAPGEQRS